MFKQVIQTKCREQPFPRPENKLKAGCRRSPTRVEVLVRSWIGEFLKSRLGKYAGARRGCLRKSPLGQVAGGIHGSQEVGLPRGTGRGPRSLSLNWARWSIPAVLPHHYLNTRAQHLPGRRETAFRHFRSVTRALGTFGAPHQLDLLSWLAQCTQHRRRRRSPLQRISHRQRRSSEGDRHVGPGLARRIDAEAQAQPAGG